MAFRLLENPYPSVVLRKFYMTNSEGATEGQALKFSSGRLTSGTAGAGIAVIANQTVTAGTDVLVECIIPLPGMIWEVGYTGTPDAGFVPGCTSCDLYTGALLLNAADITGGPCTLVSKNTSAATAQVTINMRATTA